MNLVMEKNILTILYHCTQNNFLIEYNGSQVYLVADLETQNFKFR